MGWAFHTPLCTLITTSISHLSKTKEVEFPQNENDFHYCGKTALANFLVEESESGVGKQIYVFAECVLVPRFLQITLKPPCAATAPAHWTVKTRTPPSETHRRWPVSTPRTATWRWNRPPTAKCPSAAPPPSWAAPAGMSMTLVSVLSHWCVALHRLLWRLSHLHMRSGVNSHRRRTVGLGERGRDRWKLCRPKCSQHKDNISTFRIEISSGFHVRSSFRILSSGTSQETFKKLMYIALLHHLPP